MPGGGRGGSGGSGNALVGLIGMLTGSGLVDRTYSWIGTGENQVVSDARRSPPAAPCARREPGAPGPATTRVGAPSHRQSTPAARRSVPLG
ncbi:hypothetical protein ACIOHC_14160 [Streptomyces sp. NPDC088252]|uniref:hypothetical protein n=1 Tax=Streptomyces sp. NPDC088252 TaxID=3365845 RepID=UPI00380AA504